MRRVVSSHHKPPRRHTHTHTHARKHTHCRRCPNTDEGTSGSNIGGGISGSDFVCHPKGVPSFGLFGHFGRSFPLVDLAASGTFPALIRLLNVGRHSPTRIGRASVVEFRAGFLVARSLRVSTVHGRCRWWPWVRPLSVFIGWCMGYVVCVWAELEVFYAQLLGQETVSRLRVLSTLTSDSLDQEHAQCTAAHRCFFALFAQTLTHRPGVLATQKVTSLLADSLPCGRCPRFS